MKSRWITHKGKRIFYGDYSNFKLDVQALEAEMNEVVKTVCAEPLASVLALSDVRGTRASPQALALFELVVKKTTPHIKRRTVIGISPIQQVFVGLVNKVTGRAPMRAFEDLEQAKDWLVQE